MPPPLPSGVTGAYPQGTKANRMLFQTGQSGGLPVGSVATGIPAGHKSVLAIAKRLLVASMACVTVWEITSDLCPAGTTARKPPNCGHSSSNSVAGKCVINRCLAIPHCWQAYGFFLECPKSWLPTPKRIWRL